MIGDLSRRAQVVRMASRHHDSHGRLDVSGFAAFKSLNIMDMAES